MQQARLLILKRFNLQLAATAQEVAVGTHTASKEEFETIKSHNRIVSVEQTNRNVLEEYTTMDNAKRPSTSIPTRGFKIVENLSRVTANPNVYLKSRKTFTDMGKPLNTDQSPARLATCFHRRAVEYSMPEFLHTFEHSEPEHTQTAAVLSRQRGWITLDSASNLRSKAPEFFQSSNPNQRDR